MPSANVKLRFKTEQAIDSTSKPAEGELPLRKWSIRLVQVLQGDEVTALCVDKVDYHLHETFTNPIRTISKPDFKLSEKGWGEFELLVKIAFKEGQKMWKGTHLLSFAENSYNDDIVVKFDSCPEAFVRLVKHQATTKASAHSSDDERKPSKRQMDDDDHSAKKKVKSKDSKKQLHGVDLQKLASLLESLSEKDCDQVNAIVEQHKTPGVYHKVTDEGELLLDLATLDANLMKLLWDFARSKSSTSTK